MPVVYIFDMDGTLTPPRLPMTEEFAYEFLPWLGTHTAYIATGSDFSKVKEQLPADIIDAFAGIYCAMGNQLLHGNTVVEQHDFHMSSELRNDLEEFRLRTDYPGTVFDNYIEERIGMVNFSVLGRNCPYAERERYQAWDAEHHERLNIQKLLAAKYPELEISVGGAISIDITPKGRGKGQIAQHVRQKHPNEPIVFMGDRTFPGDNDYELAFALQQLPMTECIQVDGPSEVLLELQKRN